jgi:hypothetical protein
MQLFVMQIGLSCLCAQLVKHYTMKTYGGEDVFLTSTLGGGEWSASHPSRFTPREKVLDTHVLGGWVGPTASQDDMEKWKMLT